MAAAIYSFYLLSFPSKYSEQALKKTQGNSYLFLNEDVSAQACDRRDLHGQAVLRLSADSEELRQHRHMPAARETVQRCMREMGIAGIRPGPNLSKRNAEHKIYPYLLRHVMAGYPDHIWGIDITYIRLRGVWMYLVAVLDWYSRYVVTWELDQTLAMPFVLAAVQRALAQARPAIWNSDQGSHFTSVQYTQLLLDAGVQISMDGRGRATDNIFTERPWRTVKYEEVYLKEYASPRDARRPLAAYLDFYNYRRLHQALDYQSPAALYYAQPACADDQLLMPTEHSRLPEGCG